MDVLIVHFRRNGLGIARSLAKYGHKIYAADQEKNPAVYSKYLSGFKQIEDINKVSEEEFINNILSYAQEINSKEKIFLFSLTDSHLMLFAKHWKKLAHKFYPVFETNLTILNQNIEKISMYKIATKAGVKIPLTYYSPVKPEEVQNFPVVVKPNIKGNNKINYVEKAFKIKFCHNHSELTEALNVLEKLGSQYVIQEFIPGADSELYTAGIFAYKGKLIAGVPSRKLRQFPPQTGECSYGELIKDKEIINYATKYVKESGITGICQIEFKKHNENYYLMEINPRPWSWNSLIDYAGINLPDIAINTILGKTIEPEKLKQKKHKGTWMFTLMDLKHNVLKNHNVNLFSFLFQMFKANKYAYWDKKDPKPCLMFLKKLILRK